MVSGNFVRKFSRSQAANPDREGDALPLDRQPLVAFGRVLTSFHSTYRCRALVPLPYSRAAFSPESICKDAAAAPDKIVMQAQFSAGQVPANATATLSLTSEHDVPLTERQITELHEAWLEHQINPLGEIQSRGVPYSALND